MRHCTAALFLASAFALAPAALAADEHGQPAVAAHRVEHAAAAAEADQFPHPAISTDGHWAGAIATLIFFLFLAAVVVGPIVRANMPEEVPPAHSHDEPPGASHHHGPGGTLAEEPHD